MKITPKSKIRQGRDTYEEGVEYDVPDSIGGFFVLSGWATSPDLDVNPVPQPANVELDVANGVIGQNASDMKVGG